MPTAPLEIFQLTPDQADAYAQPMQAFLRTEFEGLYVSELGRRMIILADPTDMTPGGKVDKQRERIAASTDISEADTSGYVLVRDNDEPEFSGIVGLAKFTRNDETEVEIEEFDVALHRRGEGIGPTMLYFALSRLAITPQDTLVLDVLEKNLPARSFWRSVGFSYTGNRHHHDYAFPDPKDYHLEMSAPQQRVRTAVATRLTAQGKVNKDG